MQNPSGKLFNGTEINEIKKSYIDWFENDLRSQDRATEESSYTHSGIPVKLQYTPVDVEDTNFIEDIGFSGRAPYLRGVYPNMYRGRLFTVRQLAGLGAPEDCNERIKYLMKHGANGISILFDLPTIRGYNSDDPEAEGNVGACGAAVDSIWDMDAFFKDIDQTKVSTSIVTHLPSTSIVIPGMYFAVAEQRGERRERRVQAEAAVAREGQQGVVGETERRTQVVVGAGDRHERVERVVAATHLHHHEHPIARHGGRSRRRRCRHGGRCRRWGRRARRGVRGRRTRRR